MRITFAAILVGIPAFFLLPAAWPATLDTVPPTPAYGMLRMLLSLAESLAMGLGAAAIASAAVHLREKGRGAAGRLCIGWILLMLWPIDVLAEHAAGATAWLLLLWMMRASVLAAALGAAWAAWKASGQRPRRTRDTA